MKNAYLIAAPSSDSGKTTLTMGLLRTLERRGLPVQPCKCGPDYIDTQYHKIACNRSSYNIDLWMGMEPTMEKDCLTIIEGCMGLFDGAVGTMGSNADMAERLDVPIILVVNAHSMGHSIAPLLYGYLHYRPSLRYAGVIFNNVGTPRHASILSHAANEVGMPVLGYILRQESLVMPSRHLGLDLSERERINSLANCMADEVERHVDLGLFMAQSSKKKFCTLDVSPPSETSYAVGCEPLNLPLIYVAQDEAFNFIYQETIDRLTAYGTVRFFSPLANETVPYEADCVYLPGGYPELFLPRLAESFATMESLRHTKARILAECGGMMYLGQDIDHTPMVGLLPLSTTMHGARLHLGYRILPLPDGTELRGHEFHYSTLASWDASLGLSPFHDAQGANVDTLLFRHGRIIASYIHWCPTALVRLALGA